MSDTGWAQPTQRDLGRTVLFHFFEDGVSVCSHHYPLPTTRGPHPIPLTPHAEMLAHPITRKRCRKCDRARERRTSE